MKCRSVIGKIEVAVFISSVSLYGRCTRERERRRNPRSVSAIFGLGYGEIHRKLSQEIVVERYREVQML